jgi:hypothetical protein
MQYQSRFLGSGKLSRSRDELRARGDPDLAEDVSQVRLHRSAGHEEALRDVAIPEPIRNQLHHRAFSQGQALPSGLRASSATVAAAGSAKGTQRGVDTRCVTSRAEPFEDLDTLSKVSERVFSRASPTQR